MANRNEFALGWDIGGAVAKAQLGLQGMEVGLQLALLISLWGFRDSGILPELLQAMLCVLQGGF